MSQPFNLKVYKLSPRLCHCPIILEKKLRSTLSLSTQVFIWAPDYITASGKKGGGVGGLGGGGGRRKEGV